MWMLLVLLVLAVLAWWLLGRAPAAPGAADDFPYQRRPVLLTPAERSFLGVLEQAVAGRYRVQAQVRLADLLTVRPGLAAARRTSAQNRINGKHADFVLCDPDSLAIVAAIELDDASHQQAARRQRDRFLVQACEAAGLPLLRFEAKAGYSVAALREQMAKVLGEAAVVAAAPADAPAVAPDPAPAATLPAEAERPARAKAEAGAEAAATPAGVWLPPMAQGPRPGPPSCPRCGAVTVLRTARQGAHAGKQLWGCQRYPVCKGFLPAA